MFEILGIIALSILAVIMAAVGVGMANKKSSSETQAKSVRKPHTKSVVGSALRPAVILYDFLTKDSGEGLIKDATNALRAGNSAYNEPYAYLLSGAPDEVKELVKWGAGANAFYKSLKGEKSTNFNEIYNTLTGSVTKGREAYDSALGTSSLGAYSDNSTTKEDANMILQELIDSGNVPSDTRIGTFKTERGPRNNGKLEYRGKREGKDITIEKEIYADPYLNRLAQIYASIEEILHVAHPGENEAQIKKRLDNYVLRNPYTPGDLKQVAKLYDIELKLSKHAS
ncbi:Uncharacterised protein [uncultured archaeon]|nr:Uncharacterised protein [uncultured archaeon]